MSQYDDGLKRGEFAMQGGSVVRLMDDGPNFGVAYCQFWEKHRLEIPRRGGYSFSWRRYEETVCLGSGLKVGDEGAGERERRYAERWGIKPITDPVLKLRARWTKAKIRIEEIEREKEQLTNDMRAIELAVDEILGPEAEDEES